MIDIRIEPDRARDLTIVNIRGLPNAQALIDLHYRPEYGTTRRVIWDYRQASLSELTLENLIRIAENTQATDHTRRTEALALVVRDEDELLLVKLYTEISLRMFDKQIHYLVTRSIDEARLWITGLDLDGILDLTRKPETGETSADPEAAFLDPSICPVR